jgi:hypothetical protein
MACLLIHFKHKKTPIKSGSFLIYSRFIIQLLQQ